MLSFHIRHLTPLNIHPKRITKADKNMVNDLDYESIDFLFSGKDFDKTEQKIFALMCFVTKIDWFILFIYHQKI